MAQAKKQDGGCTGIGCLILIVFAVVIGLMQSSQSPADRAKQDTDNQLTLDQYRKDELQRQDDNSARDMLLKDGHSPKETEEIVNAAHEIQNAEKKH